MWRFFPIAFVFALVPMWAAPPAEALQPGDRFLVQLSYSNFWEDLQLGVQLPDDPTMTAEERQEKMVAAGVNPQQLMAMVTHKPMGQDPLFADLVLVGEVRGEHAIEVEVRVAKVHYFDDRNRRWEIDPAKEGAQQQARHQIADLALAWRHSFRARVEREMLEEQLLGSALVLLHQATLRAEIPAPGATAGLPDLEELLQERLPDQYPTSLYPQLEWFFQEALARVVAPRPPALRQGVEFEHQGTPYRVDRIIERKGRQLVSLSGQIHRPKLGVAFKQEMLVDARSGLVVQGQALALQDAVRGRTVRYGSSRWQVRQVRYEAAGG